ncbi:MAG: hypothetical protein NT140_09765 [Deltaproteobacteria bacterium]|nr:hypothetical protein [Deltaproteobacteria bacterium]
MENRIRALENKYATAILRIERLENIVNSLTGIQEGTITMSDFIKACECVPKDKLTIQKYWDQRLGRTSPGGKTGK